MYKNFKIVKVDSKYCNYLRRYDDKVPYNAGVKDLRPFIGVLFVIESCEYFAPLSSPKEKHKSLKNKLDMIKIENEIYGVVNFNNMIPVTNSNYEEFDLNKKTNDKRENFRLELLRNQLRWLTANRKEVDKLPKSVKDRCCNFPLLEEKCKEYNKNN